MPDRSIFDRTAHFELSLATSRDMLEKFVQHRALRGLRVLDVGCRNGESVRVLTELGAEAYGIDVAGACIARAKERFPELSGRFFEGDLRGLAQFPVRDFDLVLCVGVLPYTPPRDWLPALGSMGGLCRPSGEVRVLLQRDRPRLVQGVVSAMSALPEAVFALAVAPAVTMAVWPTSRWVLGARMRPAEVHYRVSLSLYGLHFGVPPELDRFEYAIEPAAYISPALSRAFAIPAPATAAWRG